MQKRKNVIANAVVDIENPETWIPYKKSLCLDCWSGCCTLVVEVTAEDLIRLELTDQWEIENSLKNLIKRLKKERIIKRYNFKKSKFVLEQNGGEDCIYLDQNRNCSVYEKRPSVCRKHPTILGPRPGWCPYKQFVNHDI